MNTANTSPARTPRLRAGRPADLCVVGGAGHVGLPLALVFASQGLRVLIYDVNQRALEVIRRGIPPFMERGAESLLKKVLATGRLTFASGPNGLEASAFVIALGTPIDEFFNPKLSELTQALEPLLPYFSQDRLVILRSTVYPGTTAWLQRHLQSKGQSPAIAFCPERVVEGRAIEEIQTLPQIVSGLTPEAEQRAADLFARIAPQIVRLRPLEAEFAKLFCNAYRYIQFAATNQFYMMATSAGLDYYRILQGLQQDYPRMRDMPRAGFSAGPCLLKDTMQLTACYDNEFSLGYTAMLVNESLPLYVVRQLAHHGDLARLTVGILGMAFKANSDDPRSSLGYKLKKALRFTAKRVLATDPYVKDPELAPLEVVIAQSDLLILGVPHSVYEHVNVRGKPMVDIWNFFGRGGAITLKRPPGAGRRPQPYNTPRPVTSQTP